MTRFLAIASVSFFVVCITAKDITALAWQLWYQVNQEYVAKELCVNRAKPQLQCNGKCHLMKQLRNLEEPDSQSANSTNGPKKHSTTVLKLKTLDWIPGTALALIPDTAFQQTDFNEWPELKQVLTSYSLTVFHPPITA